MNQFVLSTLLALIANSTTVRCIDYQRAKNSKGDLQFVVQLDRNIEFVNLHRSNNPFLSVSLNGATMDKLEEVNGTAWKLMLSDNSTVEIAEIDTKNSSGVNGLYLLWHGGGPNTDREVCFQYAFKNASWYNTNNQVHPKWPMDTKKTLPKVHFNSMLNDTDDIANGEFYRVQELLFVNTDGFAVLLDDQQPLYIRRDPNHGDALMCFSVDNQLPYSQVTQDPSYLDIKIRLFVSANIRSVLDYVIHQSGYIPKPTAIPSEMMFKYPSYWGLGDSNLLTYANDLKRHGHENGQIISQVYSGYKGDLIFPTNLDLNVSDLLQLGFYLNFPHLPNVVRNSKITEPYFIKTLDNHKTGLVDFSNPDACEWYEALLRKLHYDDGVYSFYLWSFDPPMNGVKLYDHEFEKYPNKLVTKYVETVSRVMTNNSLLSEVAFRTQHLPVFVQVWNGFQPFDQYFKSLIAGILSISIGGYSFVSPSAIGWPETTNEEMYIRWIQAITFMPHIQINQLSWKSSFSANCVALTKKYLDLHTQHSAVFIELAKKRVSEGSPIIRPMWYAAPDDPRTYTIDDQFMVGNDILVAPVMLQGQRERTVFLPPGEWIDHRGGGYAGGKVVKISAPLEELPYFKRKI